MAKDITITIDSIVKNGDTKELKIVGWALDQTLKVAPKITWNRHDLTIECTPLYRMDVNTLFELPNEVSAGFEIIIQSAGVSGKVNFSFATSANQKDYVVKLKKNYPLIAGTETPLQAKVLKVKKGLRYLKKNGVRNAIKRYQLEKLIDGNEYRAWIFQNETNDFLDLEQQLAKAEWQPTISIIMPVYNVDPKWLAKAVESVQNQLYTNWELCICNDASTNVETNKFVDWLSESDDPRIKVIVRSENGHISLASNDALKLASGEYIALMDHDDTLAKNALAEVVLKLNQQKDVALIYSDEDKINSNDERFEPAFKPDWSPDLLMGTNYISHLGVYKRSIANEIGGFRAGYEGAQDYDFLLRFVERIKESQIAHIPKVLYHWRAIAGSTASDSQQKDYTNEAGLRALNDTFKRRNLLGRVENGVASGFYDITYQVLQEELVSVIIPTKNGYEDLKACVDSIIEKTNYSNYEIIIADNGSDDPKMKELYTEYQKKLGERFSAQSIDIPFNYSRINNIAAKLAKGKYLLFLNNDTEVIAPNWMTTLVSYCQFDRVGCVGAKLLYPDNTIQHAGIVMGLGDVAGHGHHYFPKGDLGYFGRLYLDGDYMAVTAACVMVKKVDFDAVNGFDEEFVVAFNDVDLCLKIYDLGRYNIWAHKAELYHYESKSRGYENTPEKMQRFDQEKKLLQKKWRHYIDNDPFYSPHLTRGTGNFTINVDMPE